MDLERAAILGEELAERLQALDEEEAQAELREDYEAALTKSEETAKTFATCRRR